MVNRILVALVALTLIVQVGILYQQHRAGSVPVPSGREQSWDAEEGSLIDLSGVPLLGSPNAPLVLVEFSDFECPYCQRHATGAGQELDRRFVFAGQLQHAFMNNPLPIHQSARLLATAAMCSALEDRFWDMHKLLFERNPRVAEDIIQLAVTLGMNQARVRGCVENPETANRVDKDIQVAQKFGLTGTPAFAIGRKISNEQMLVNKFVMGAQRVEVFEALLKEMLSREQKIHLPQ